MRLPSHTYNQQPTSPFTLGRRLLLGVCLFSSLATVGHAQTTTPASLPATSTASSTPDAATSTVPATTPTTTPATPTTTLSPAAQTRVINLAANITNQLEATADRLSNITTRLQSRLERLATMGIDTTIPQARIADATANLEAFRSTLATIDQDVYVVATSPHPRVTWPPVKAQFTTARAQLVAAYEALRSAVAAAQTLNQ